MTTAIHRYDTPDNQSQFSTQTPEPYLGDTSVSHPHLLNHSSRQSITASEDFYSLSESGTAAEQEASTPTQARPHLYPEFSHLQEPIDPTLRTPIRKPSPVDHSSTTQEQEEFITPPSRNNSASHDEVGRAVTTASAVPPQAIAPPAFDKQLRRKPVSSVSTSSSVNSVVPIAAPIASAAAATDTEVTRRQTVIHKPAEVERSPLVLDNMDGRSAAARAATPGTDDMPFIRFAIDQLTRDEEVRGSRAYGGGQPQTLPASLQPAVPRRASGLGIQTRGPVQRPAESANRPQTRKAESVPVAPVPQRSPKRTSSVKMQALPPAVLPSAKAKAEAELQTDDESPPPIAHYDVFMPYEHELSDQHLPELTALPTILKPLWLGIFMFLCLLMLVGLIFCGAWSQKHDGLWGYGHFGDNRYFTFHYLPTIFGMILVVWLLHVQIALQRVAPFMAMASYSDVARSQAAFLDLYPTQFLHPKLQYFQTGQWIFGAFFVISWIFLLTIPLLSASFNVRYTTGDDGRWRWVAVQGVIWTVVALYVLLIILLVALFIYLRRNETGLKWDARSLADIVALLERANIMSDYADSETFATRGQFSQRLWTRADRLGYWHTSRRPQDIFYGIGAEGAAARRYSLEQGQLREKTVFGHSRETSNSSEVFYDDKGHHGEGARRDLRDPFVLARHVPWMLTTWALLAFTIVALALFVAFLTVSFVDSATIAGFLPSLRSMANSHGFSPANFLYSFVPGLLGLLCILLWQPLDFAIRRMAVFSALSHPDGAVPANSLLLDYPAQALGSCTLRALRNRDWLVAFSSFITFISTVIPILAGGVFWAQYHPDSSDVRVSAEKAGWYALWFFLAVYFLAYPVLLITAFVKRGLVPALPHKALCLAELLSWLYMSPVITDPLFARIHTKHELVKRLSGSTQGSLTGDNSSAPTPIAPHNQFPQSNNLSPRPTVRLLGDDAATSQTEAFIAAHNQLPGYVRTSPRNSSISNHSLNMTRPLPRLVRASGPIRFAFGIYIGRDGREHLGIDRFVRDGREMIVMEKNARSSGWLWH